ncbi:YlxR family protein [Blastococcus sp. SYSU D00669]
MGCRKRVPVTDLLRVVARSGTLVPDPRRRLPGRGASLHPTPECLHAAERRRAFGRALRCSVPLEAGPLRAHVLGASPESLAGADRDGRSTAGPAAPRANRHQAGEHIEVRTSSDESAVKSQR